MVVHSSHLISNKNKTKQNSIGLFIYTLLCPAWWSPCSCPQPPTVGRLFTSLLRSAILSSPSCFVGHRSRSCQLRLDSQLPARRWPMQCSALACPYAKCCCPDAGRRGARLPGAAPWAMGTTCSIQFCAVFLFLFNMQLKGCWRRGGREQTGTGVYCHCVDERQCLASLTGIAKSFTFPLIYL